jgi:LmbE family N-acetylglucosaminyl deacetylase
MGANKKKPKSRAALFLSAHADDAEFGCGGIIQKMVLTGVRAASLIFSISEETVNITKYPKDFPRKECESSAKILGLKDLGILNYPVRRFPQYRQGILQDMLTLLMG